MKTNEHGNYTGSSPSTAKMLGKAIQPANEIRAAKHDRLP